MGKRTVMICDDNIAVHKSLANYLKADGIDVLSVYDGETALQEFQRNRVDIVVLDLMLPGMSGEEVCREIRRTSNVYIIMLSAKGEEFDRVLGLELGADDYVTKPYSPREVVARIRRVMRRMYAKQDQELLQCAELTIYPDAYKAFIRDEQIDVSPREVGALALMITHVGKALTREHILNVVWGFDYCGDIRVVDTMIKRLRQKLTRSDVHFRISTIYGVGYMLEEIS